MADKKATAEVVDFTNVKDGGQFNKRHRKPGDYKGKVTKVQDAVKKDDKSVKMWLFTINVDGGTYPYYCNRNDPNQAWKIRNLFVAAGINVPKKRVKVDPNLVVGKTIGVSLEDDEYNNKVNSAVSATFPPSELEGSGDDDEDGDEGDTDEEEVDEPTPAKSGKKAKEGKKGKKSKEADPEPVEAPQGKKGKKDKAKKAKAVDDVSDDELEELEIEDL